MRVVRAWGPVAACVAVVVVSGCGGSDGGGEAASSPSASVTSSGPAVVESPVETAPVYPEGPEGDIDRRADEAGWTYDSIYGSASEFVQDICESLPVSAKDGSSRPQWLVESGMLDGDGAAILKVGVPKLCTRWGKTLKAAVSGKYERWVGAGDYDVVAKPGPFKAGEDVQEVAAGSYRTQGDLSDCYWERTSRSGDIIANNFATQARSITVTLRVGELFHSEGCGVWKPL